MEQENNKKKALVFVANGSEEMEAVISADVLRRGQIEVCVAGVSLEDKQYATCSRGVKIVPDIQPSDFSKFDVSSYDVIVIPGGLGGAKTLSSHSDIQHLLSLAHKSGKYVAAICAGPLALKGAKINLGGKITSHPIVKEELEHDYNYQEDRVVVDNKVITSRGPGTAFLFALRIVEELMGKEMRDKISPPMILPPTL
ncbi:hypothetical protein Glove_216g198 [Diversispora epigaea]|uniref:D-lactate dehydratase n=1 Tax=Diversispora epigaea TaxID=1348612 RepID=A0A397IHL6_9GLOM|nr:hypothetical protein Glove_216g198 [Diversispora epigaea]